MEEYVVFVIGVSLGKMDNVLLIVQISCLLTVHQVRTQHANASLDLLGMIKVKLAHVTKTLS
jgi:hypothetical protein